ncbi:conserved hypothetical protein [Gammaproteobacteria bacterium]
MNSIEDKILNMKVYHGAGQSSLHKPLLVLFALGYCYLGRERMISFLTIDNILKKLFKDFYAIALENSNTHYPFGKLENDNFWIIEQSSQLKRTSVGHLSKSELLAKNIHAGFTEDIYYTLKNDKKRIINIANQLLQRYFPLEQHATLLAAVGLPKTVIEEDALDAHNGFIAYLNSLHNLGAGGANALAETQALNHYFAPLYQPFPIVDAVWSALRDGCNRVVVLTGHAGDGKSTVALDVLKRLRELPPDLPLQEAIKEREVILLPGGSVTVVKDMSELSAQVRLQWLDDAFNQSGSWLVISNTGPLLNSLHDFSKLHGISGDIESELLAKMDTPYEEGTLERHTLPGFPKDLVILNLTRLDNVVLGSRVLTKMLNHPAWADCIDCPAEAACPLQLNRRALQSLGSMVEDRARWVYQRLTHYEQRLTLRQMVAHLALSLTGGMNCSEAQRYVENSTAKGAEKGVEGLAKIIFSEGFFGYRNGEPWVEAEGLRAVALARRLAAGGPVAVDYERQLVDRSGMTWANLPKELEGLSRHWSMLAVNSTGVRWRFALRRMLYLFGQPTGSSTNIFLDTFLRSPKLRDFDRWQREHRVTLSVAEKKKFCKACLRVLLEFYSGFSAGQFHDQDHLYLTLRRADRAVVQPTQWVAAKLPFDAFDIDFDRHQHLPTLRYYRTGGGEVVLKLSLPLLDYIQARNEGELGGELARIHYAQLEAFRAELLRMENHARALEEITLLRARIDGQVCIHRYIFDLEQNTLEIDR